MVVSFEPAKAFSNPVGDGVNFGPQKSLLPPDIKLNKLESDTVSFSGWRKEKPAPKPYVSGSIVDKQTYVIPKNYKTTEPVKVDMYLEVSRGAEVGSAECLNSATLEGKVDSLKYNLDDYRDAGIIRVGKHAKIREIIIGDSENPTRDARIYFAIHPKALKDPENFQKIIINGKELPREEFIQFAQKSENVLPFSQLTLKSEEYVPDNIFAIFKEDTFKEYDI